MSMKKSEDPRAIRSKEMFKNAVFSLLSEGIPISNLTVQKVAAKAGLNRTTFYLHFQDIQDLLAKLNDEILIGLSDKIDTLMQRKGVSEKQQLIQLLDYLYAQRNHLFTLFNINQFEDQLFSFIKELVETKRMNISKEVLDEQVSVETKTASLVGIIMWWIKKGMHLSSDYMADQIYLIYNV